MQGSAVEGLDAGGERHGDHFSFIEVLDRVEGCSLARAVVRYRTRVQSGRPGIHQKGGVVEGYLVHVQIEGHRYVGRERHVQLVLPR